MKALRSIAVTMVCAAIMSVGLAGASIATVLAPGDWSQFRHGPEHDGFNPDETTLSPNTVNGLQLHWQVQVQAPYYFGEPLVAGSTSLDTEFGPANGPIVTARVEARNSATGTIRWVYDRTTAGETHGDVVQAVADGIVYVMDTRACGGFFCRINTLIALDATTGAERWSVVIQKPASRAVIAEG